MGTVVWTAISVPECDGTFDEDRRRNTGWCGLEYVHTIEDEPERPRSFKESMCDGVVLRVGPHGRPSASE